MTDNRSLSMRPLGELIAEIASDDVAPGAGSAAAIGLALAAACAGKAVAISLKHRPSDAVLAHAKQTLNAIAHRALSGADDDAKQFREFMATKQDEAARRLVESGTQLQQVGAALRDVLDAIEPSIDAPVSGDLHAARALCAAFSTIQDTNLAENAAELEQRT